MRNFVLSVSVLVLAAFSSAQADFLPSVDAPDGFKSSQLIGAYQFVHNPGATEPWYPGSDDAVVPVKTGDLDYEEAPVFDDLGDDGLFIATLADLGIAKLDYIRLQSANYVNENSFAMIDQLYVSDSLSGVQDGSTPLFNYDPANGWVNDAYITVTDSGSLLSEVFIRISDGVVGTPDGPYGYTISFYGTPVTPEPATMLIFGVGLAGAGVAALRRRKK